MVGLLSCIPSWPVPYPGRLSLVELALVAIFILYMRLSLVLEFGMLIFVSVCLGFAH